MKLATALIFAICAGVAYGGVRTQISEPRTAEHEADIMKQHYKLNPDGSYSYGFETSNGIQTQERGYLKNAGTEIEAQVKEGSYSYTGPDGVLYTVTYTADENGYRAEGAHLPTPPPVNHH